MNPDDSPVVVVGAGPAGLMAAETLARAGVRVIMLERMPSVGRKFLLAGRGGLNLTHSEPLDRLLRRYGVRQPALEPLIRRFPPEALKAWAEGLGQPLFVGSSGRVFPRAMKASPLLRAWLARLTALEVEIRTRTKWTGWTEGGALQIEGPDGPATLEAQAAILALGGASWPRLGSDGAWTGLLAAQGAPSAPLEASNMGVNVPWSPLFKAQSGGAPLKAAAFRLDGVEVKGEAMVTAYGLEGGALYALSPQLRRLAARGMSARLRIDLRPDLTLEQLEQRLGGGRSGQSLTERLRKAVGLSPVERLLLREPHGAAPPSDARSLAALIKGVDLPVTGLQGLERAISTAGGVRFEALDERLMVRARPGLFLAGEMLDWDAPTGGYLLQAALATGVAAAEGVLAWRADHQIRARSAGARYMGSPGLTPKAS